MGGEDKKLFKMEIFKQIRGNYSLVPIFLIASFGCTLAALSCFRTLTRSPDVAINKAGNPKNYEKLVDKDGKDRKSVV